MRYVTAILISLLAVIDLTFVIIFIMSLFGIIGTLEVGLSALVAVGVVGAVLARERFHRSRS